jgi:hypothetical protein
MNTEPLTTAGEASDYTVLMTALEKVGIEFIMRESEGGFRFVFISPRQTLEMKVSGLEIKDAPLDLLQMSNRFIEFDSDGSLASY